MASIDQYDFKVSIRLGDEERERFKEPTQEFMRGLVLAILCMEMEMYAHPSDEHMGPKPYPSITVQSMA